MRLLISTMLTLFVIALLAPKASASPQHLHNLITLKRVVGQAIRVTESHVQSRTPDVPPGLAAIAVRTANTTGSNPGFTTDDVIGYLSAHPYSLGHTVNGTPATVSSVVFMTARQASILLRGEDVGRTGDSLVCYAELHGPFAFSLASVPSGTVVQTYRNIVYIFDGHTGNLLLIGGNNYTD